MGAANLDDDESRRCDCESSPVIEDRNGSIEGLQGETVSDCILSVSRGVIMPANPIDLSPVSLRLRSIANRIPRRE